MIALPELDAFTTRFAQCHYEPLRVIFNLLPNSRVVNYDPIHLDGLLARAVVTQATQGKMVSDQKDGYWIPLPLKMLWRDEKGFPLWASSVLYPASPSIEDVYIRHKRNPPGNTHNKKKLVTKSGPWMPRRIPTPTLVCDRYEARCIGNFDAVKNLLNTFDLIGKLRLGRIKSITVEQADFTEQDVFLADGKLIKPIPAEANLVSWWQSQSSMLIGWTPPHWKPGLFRLGFQANTKIK